MTSPLIEVQKHGQSLWYDYISRDLLLSGELRRLVEEDGVRGVTSNPAIFEKAIAGSSDYDPAIQSLVGQGQADAQTIYEALAVQDIQLGCDVLRPVYDATDGADGYVSLEVSPHLAYDTEATLDEARHLWDSVGRPNLMIKVPATTEGLPAIEQLIAEGINVNATLLFAVGYYEGVHQAYRRGLAQLIENGGDASRVASVASFFVSRIDAVIEKRVATELAESATPDHKARLEGLLAKVAIANAVDAYASFQRDLASPEWAELAAHGARPQRVLWASTGTKNPDLPATLYVDELIGPDTVNTVPAATFEAFKNQGTVADALGGRGEATLQEARAVMTAVEELGISFQELTDDLLTKGCALFCDAFDQVLGAVAEKRDALTKAP
ncbi:MAG: transaldolase [Myxococcota bacterium]|jgi:transaldolase / glucose-6-phosphate isomerase|nr:transaldolase [Myxococcota bacterium]